MENNGIGIEGRTVCGNEEIDVEVSAQALGKRKTKKKHLKGAKCRSNSTWPLISMDGDPEIFQGRAGV